MSIEFEINVIDNATEVLDKIANTLAKLNEGLGETAVYADALTKSQVEFERAVGRTNLTLQQQQLNAIGALTAINTLSSGVRLLSLSIIRLNFLGEENKKTLMEIIAVFQLLAGVTSIIKAITLASRAMGSAEAILAKIETYRAVLKNPWMAMVAGAAIGTASAAGAYMLLGGNTTNQSNLNIYYQGPSSIQDANSRVVSQVIQGDKI